MRKFLFCTVVLCIVVHLVPGEIIAPVRLVTINGIVTDDPYPNKRMSQPIENVKVELWHSSPIYDTQSSPVIGPLSVWQKLDSTVTDGQGKFAFKPINSGSYQIRCSHSGYADNQVTIYTLRDTSVTILLVAASAKAHVTGTVSESCHDPLGMPCVMSPIAQCTVTVTKSTNTFEPALTTTYSTVTNNAGQYSFDSIPVSSNGEHITILSTKSGFSTQSVDTVIRNYTTTTVNFTLTSKVETLKDSVGIKPANPTSKDSLQFELRNMNHCCATQYSNKVVSVQDTTILLSYTYNDTMCDYVDCLVGWSKTTFSSGPIKAGTYSIYKVESPYCPPGRICPLYMTAPVRVGSVTVAKSTGINFSGIKASEKAKTELIIAGSSVIASVQHSGPVSLCVYDMRGTLLAELFNGTMSTGAHLYNLDNALGKHIPQGTLLVRLLTNGKMVASKTVTAVH